MFETVSLAKCELVGEDMKTSVRALEQSIWPQRSVG